MWTAVVSGHDLALWVKSGVPCRKEAGWAPLMTCVFQRRKTSYCRVLFLRLLMNVVSEESLLNFIVIPLGVFKRRATISNWLGDRV